MSETAALTHSAAGSSIRARRPKRRCFIELWLGTKVSPHTRRAYRSELERFRAAAGKPLGWITMMDLQA